MESKFWVAGGCADVLDNISQHPANRTMIYTAELAHKSSRLRRSSKTSPFAVRVTASLPSLPSMQQLLALPKSRNPRAASSHSTIPLPPPHVTRSYGSVTSLGLRTPNTGHGADEWEVAQEEEKQPPELAERFNEWANDTFGAPAKYTKCKLKSMRKVSALRFDLFLWPPPSTPNPLLKRQAGFRAGVLGFDPDPNPHSVMDTRMMMTRQTRRLLRETLGSAGAQAPCWEWPGAAWPSTGCCLRQPHYY